MMVEIEPIFKAMVDYIDAVDKGNDVYEKKVAILNMLENYEITPMPDDRMEWYKTHREVED